MDPKNIPDEVELNVNTPQEEFKFATETRLLYTVKDGKLEVLDVISIHKVPKKPGRPVKKAAIEFNPKWLKRLSNTLEKQYRPKLAAKLDEAVEWLEEQLDPKHSRWSTELFFEAEELGIKRKTVYRAAKILNVIKVPVINTAKKQEWHWRLPNDNNQSTGVAQHAEGSESDLDPPRSQQSIS